MLLSLFAVVTARKMNLRQQAMRAGTINTQSVQVHHACMANPRTDGMEIRPGKYGDWMRDFATNRFEELILLGSHDAGCIKGKTTNGLYKKWAETQTADLHDQLCGGYREFDIRFHQHSGTWEIHHGGYWFQNMAEVGKDIRDFCNAHHDEVIVLRIKMESGSPEQKVTGLLRFEGLINGGDRKCVVRGEESVDENFTRKTLRELKGMVPSTVKGSAVIFMLVALDSEKQPEYGHTYNGPAKSDFFKLAFKYENNEKGKYSNERPIASVVSKQIRKVKARASKCSGPPRKDRCFLKLANVGKLRKSIKIGPRKEARCEDCALRGKSVKKLRSNSYCTNPKDWAKLSKKYQVPKTWCSDNCKHKAPKCEELKSKRKCHYFSHCGWAEKFGFWMTSTGQVDVGVKNVEHNSRGLFDTKRKGRKYVEGEYNGWIYQVIKKFIGENADGMAGWTIWTDFAGDIQGRTRSYPTAVIALNKYLQNDDETHSKASAIRAIENSDDYVAPNGKKLPPLAEEATVEAATQGTGEEPEVVSQTE